MSSVAKEGLPGVLGNGAAQLLSIATMPIVTRVYPPDEYGVLATFLSLLALFMPVAALRLNTAIVLPRLNSHARYLKAAGYIAAVLVAGAIGLAVGLADILGMVPPKGISALWESGLVYLLPVAVMALGWQQTEIGFAIRYGNFKSIAWSRLLETATDRLLSILAGALIGPAAGILIASRLIGLSSAWGFLRSARGFGRGFHENGPVSIRRVISAVSRRRSLPSQFSLGYLVEAIGRNAPIVIMAGFFESAEIGAYALAMMVANVPLVLLGDPLAQVFLRSASLEKHNRLAVRELTRTMTTLIVVTFVPLILVLATVGPGLFAQIFGVPWADAGALAAIVAISGPAALGHRILGSLYEIYDWPRARLVSDLVTATAKVVLVAFAVANGIEVVTVVAVVTAISVLGYGTALEIAVRREVGCGLMAIVEWRKLWPIIIVMLAAAFSVLWGANGPIVGLVWIVALSVYVYMLAPGVLTMLTIRRRVP